MSLLTLAMICISTSGCSVTSLNATKQDQIACNEVSDLIQNSDGSLVLDAGYLHELSKRLENQALPKASMHFGGQIKAFIDAEKKTEQSSIFSKAAGTLLLEEEAARILRHCISIEMKK